MDIFCVCVSSPCRYADAATTYHRSLSLKIEEKFVRFLFSLLSIFVCFFLQRHFLSILWLCLCLNLNIVSYIRKSKWNRILDIQLFVFFRKEIKGEKSARNTSEDDDDDDHHHHYRHAEENDIWKGRRKKYCEYDKRKMFESFFHPFWGHNKL